MVGGTLTHSLPESDDEIEQVSRKVKILYKYKVSSSQAVSRSYHCMFQLKRKPESGYFLPWLSGS